MLGFFQSMPPFGDIIELSFDKFAVLKLSCLMVGQAGNFEATNLLRLNPIGKEVLLGRDGGTAAIR